MYKSESNKPASFCILTYNQEKYIADAVYAALNQNYNPLEIIISDDNSSDNTYAIIESIISDYKGPHKIILNKNNKNMGIREHTNKVLYELCHGEYIILAAGDDVSTTDRTTKSVEYFEKFPNLMSLSCLTEETDELGNVLNPDELWDGTYTLYNLSDYIYVTNFMMFSGNSRALRRKVITSFDRLEEVRDEDIFLYIRSLLLGQACYIREPLVKHRHHGNNMSANRSSDRLLETMSRQLEKDINYAYENGYIDEIHYKRMNKKKEYIMDTFYTYSTSPFKNPKILFYRIMKKLGFIKFYPPIKSESNKLTEDIFLMS